MEDRFGRFSLALFEISRHWYRLAGDEMARHGLKAPHAIYLTALYRSEDGLTGPELCQRCGRDKSDVSRTLALLEEQGLVVKDLVNGSRYRGLLRLTQAGRAAEKGQLATLPASALTPLRQGGPAAGLCPRCGASNPPGSAFCNQCGGRLG